MGSTVREKVKPPQQIGRSVGALAAGFVVNVVLSLGTDAAFVAMGLMPAIGHAMNDSQSLLAAAYRTLYGVLSSYAVARMAPYGPVGHALVGGAIGMVLATAGTCFDVSGGKKPPETVGFLPPAGPLRPRVLHLAGVISHSGGCRGTPSPSRSTLWLRLKTVNCCPDGRIRAESQLTGVAIPIYRVNVHSHNSAGARASIPRRWKDTLDQSCGTRTCSGNPTAAPKSLTRPSAALPAPASTAPPCRTSVRKRG